MKDKTIILDDWQRDILDYEGHIGLAKGRRIGATHLFAIKAVEHMVKHENHHPSSQIVCMSITEDQAKLIISFATAYAQAKYPSYIAKGKDKPTLNRLVLKIKGNRRILLARPVGATGASARGFEGQVLMVDEAAFHPSFLWDAAKPILMTTGGKIWMWSTFNGKSTEKDRNYFWDKYEEAVEKKDPKARFKFWVKDSEQVIKNRPISASWTREQREEAIKFLEEEKRDMSPQSYAQEYMAIASEHLKQFFPNDLIEMVCTLDPSKNVGRLGDFYGGFDLARMGGDQFTAEILKKIDNDAIIQVDHYSKTMLDTVENENLVKEFTLRWDCVKSAIDSGSGTLGVSVLDHLLRDEAVKRRIVAINNRKVIIDKDNGTQKLFKVDLYDNLKAMMYRGQIKLFNSEEVKSSLRSVQIDMKENAQGITQATISGRFTHIAEGLVRAAWLAREKSLNVWMRSIRI